MLYKLLKKIIKYLYKYEKLLDSKSKFQPETN
jgi:lysylphosphatidylglycerol synthetase-like protein (DUF2156 family)